MLLCMRSRNTYLGRRNTAINMLDNHYANSKLAELYDFDSGWSSDRDFYLSLAESQPQMILDLGCGTGLLCSAYAGNGHQVTGVDPSSAMLEIARRKPHGDKIEWVQSTAQSYRSGKLFDLIIMTGHAFQVLLKDADILETFSTMQKHLKPGGTVVFESRNPLIDWQNEWDYEMVIDLPKGKVTESRRFLAMNSDLMKFELRYQFSDETLISKSELRFLSQDEINKRLSASGLSCNKVLGGWDGRHFDESCREMIFIVHTRTNLI